MKKIIEDFPCTKCFSANRDKSAKQYKTLVMTQKTIGFATEVIIKCIKCSYCMEMFPKNRRGKFDGAGSKGWFMKYGINYCAMLLMQHLGLGVQGLTQMLAFLGIGASEGKREKWKDIQSATGAAQQHVKEKVLISNIMKEIAATKKKIDPKWEEWLQSKEGKGLTQEQKETKKKELVQSSRRKDWHNHWH
jgi:hypothetical protein